MGQPVVHWELMSKDPAKVAAFYAGLFGWKVHHRPELNYRIVETGSKEGINGGILKPEREGPWPGNMLFYIAVDDLGAYRPSPLPGVGRPERPQAEPWRQTGIHRQLSAESQGLCHDARRSSLRRRAGS